MATTDDARVDVNFTSAGRLDVGNVPMLQPIDETRLRDQLRTGVFQPTGCSKFARGCTAVGSFLTGVGAIAMLARMKIIKPDEIGLARGFDGNVFILNEGCRLVETLYRNVEVFKINNNNIEMHPMHIIRILPGKLGLCKFDGVPHVMAAGRHFINDPLFEYKGAVDVTAAYIKNDTISIIIVPTGKVACVAVKGVGHILEAGQHWINNPDLAFNGQFLPASAEYIRANAKHRILIPMGKVGLGWRKNEGILLEANKSYFIDDPDFRYIGSVSMLEERIEHGAFKIITVNKGLVGVAFDDGKLQILPPGRHIVKRETWNFASMLSTGQETIPIAEIVNLSSDNVGLRFSAALNVQVIDAAKAVTMLGRDLSKVQDTRIRNATEFSAKVFHDNIRDRARLALSIIIGNNPFTETFLSTSAIGSSSDDGKTEDSFKGIIHDAFMNKFSHEMLDMCGVKVIDMSIADIDIVNEELSHALAQAAVKATELEMAKIDRNVEMQRALTEVNALKIRAEGEGKALAVDAQATAKEINILAEAECERIREVDKALAGTSDATQMRELIKANGASMGNTKNTVVVARSSKHLAEVLSGKTAGDKSGGKRK